MRIIFLSDTHGFYPKIEIPDGDILIHSGDFGRKGTLAELEAFYKWFSSFPHAQKIFVAGNHDWCFEMASDQARAYFRDVHYLQDRALEIDGIKFYGSPWQPRFHDWAFNADRGAELKAIWSMIPDDTDVLITHGPPYGILDRTARGDSVGCEDLLTRVKEVKPSYHLFGHIHEGYGTSLVEGTFFVNGSICDVAYRPVNPAIILTF